MNAWSVVSAKAKFSTIVENARKRPQIINKRNKPVAILMDIGDYKRMETASNSAVPSIKSLISELHKIQKEEKVVIEVPPRQDRVIAE